MFVFNKGEYVAAINKGVCKVEDVTTLDLTGVDKEREYYILKPVYVPGSTAYVPVDTAESALRPVISNDEANLLIAHLKDIPVLEVPSEKLLEQEYKGCMKSNDCTQWVKLIKTIYLRKKKRLDEGRRETAIDSKYGKLAESSLFGELSVAMNISKGEVQSFFQQSFSTL